MAWVKRRRSAGFGSEKPLFVRLLDAPATAGEKSQMDCLTFTNSGQLGDTVGGWANVLTALLALFAAWQFNSWKKQHAFETRAETAKTMWLAAYRLLSAMKSVRNPVRRNWDDEQDSPQDTSLAGSFARLNSGRLEELERAANNFLDSWAVCELYFDGATLSGIESVWKERAALEGQMALWLSEVDVLGRQSDESWEAFFGVSAREHVEDVERRIKAVLKPLAIAK